MGLLSNQLKTCTWVQKNKQLYTKSEALLCSPEINQKITYCMLYDYKMQEVNSRGR